MRDTLITIIMKTYWNYNEGDLDESDSDKGLLQI